SLTRAKGFAAQGAGKDGKGNLTVSFTVDPKAIVKDFAKGSSVVVDIYGAAAALSAKTEPPIPEKSGVDKAAGQPETGAKTVQPESKNVTAKTEPAAAVPSEETPKAEKPQKDETPAAAKAEVPLATAAQIGTEPLLAATFDPKVAVGAVIFSRGGYGTILFDRKIAMDRAALTSASPLRIKLEPVDLQHNNGFRFVLPENTDVRATRTGTAWKIFLVKKADEPAVSTGFVAQPDFALGARVLLPTTGAPDPVRYIDPVVGDELILVPLRETSAFSIPRRLADFSVIPAAQGLVVKPLQEKVVIRTFAEGIEITTEGGLKLSPAGDTGATQTTIRKKRGGKGDRFFFDFSLWKGKPNESFTVTRQKLSQTIVDVPEAERNLARLELARFYFARGMGSETLSLLSVLTRQSPELVYHPEFLALRGAAYILSGHAQEGLRDLGDPALNANPEIELWQAVGAAQLRDWQKAEEKFNFTEDVLTTYAEPFHSRFSVLAVEAAIGMDKDREAAEWLERLETQPHLPEIEPAMKYLQGVLHSKSGRADAAEKLWREVARSDDRLYKIRAELALVDLGVATRSLTPLQAAERLEGLRYAWRGDDLELDILHRLGTFYIEAGNFKSGLSVLAQAVHLYPNSPLTPPIRAEMAKTFHDIYLTDLGARLSPVEALTLYQTYPELLPSGEESNALKSNLAERLVAIDLLDQAAGLLEEQVKNGLKGETKARIGARLAAIRLLDRKPGVALTALDLSQSDIPPGTISADLENQRQLLRARALSDQGKNDEALGLLQNNTSKAAIMLKADITMRAQRWAEAAKVLLDLIGTPPRAGELLTPEQAQWLVNCAIALSLANDLSGLDHLAIDFSAAMAGTSQRDTFRVLTRPEKIGQMRDIAAAQAKITEVDMFRGFLDAYRSNPEAKKDKDKKK
ncbi:MAG: hypothetical protein PHY92_02290, partial [Alphaproteobacteria bacterium]|nr:hypothetical protein [Alphaproteobacteria bacterium]